MLTLALICALAQAGVTPAGPTIVWGDANWDGEVNFGDQTAVLTAWGAKGAQSPLLTVQGIHAIAQDDWGGQNPLEQPERTVVVFEACPAEISMALGGRHPVGQPRFLRRVGPPEPFGPNMQRLLDFHTTDALSVEAAAGRVLAEIEGGGE